MQPVFLRQFGVTNPPPCPRCAGEMFVSRRSPAVTPRHELQLLTCTKCSYTLSRTVDVDGNTVGAN